MYFRPVFLKAQSKLNGKSLFIGLNCDISIYEHSDGDVVVRKGEKEFKVTHTPSEIAEQLVGIGASIIPMQDRGVEK